MKLIPELYWLTIVALTTLMMWAPHILESFMRRGLLASMGNPHPSDPSPPPWADRAKRAHLNAVDNLVVFAPLVLVLAATGISTAATLFAAKLYFAARLGHYFAYLAGIPVLRTALFLFGVGATIVIGIAALGALA